MSTRVLLKKKLNVSGDFADTCVTSANVRLLKKIGLRYDFFKLLTLSGGGSEGVIQYCPFCKLSKSDYIDSFLHNI